MLLPHGNAKVVAQVEACFLLATAEEGAPQLGRLSALEAYKGHGLVLIDVEFESLKDSNRSASLCDRLVARLVTAKVPLEQGIVSEAYHVASAPIVAEACVKLMHHESPHATPECRGESAALLNPPTDLEGGCGRASFDCVL